MTATVVEFLYYLDGVPFCQSAAPPPLANNELLAELERAPEVGVEGTGCWNGVGRRHTEEEDAAAG